MHNTLTAVSIALLLAACSGRGKTKPAAKETPVSDAPANNKAKWAAVPSGAKGALQKTLAAAYKVTPDEIQVAPLAPHPPAHWPQAASGAWQPLVASKKGMPQQRGFATDKGQVFLRLTHPNGVHGFFASRVADGGAKADPVRLAQDILWVYERAGGGIVYPRHAHGAKLIDPPATFTNTADGAAVLRFRVEWAGDTGSTGEYDVEVRSPKGKATTITGRPVPGPAPK